MPDTALALSSSCEHIQTGIEYIFTDEHTSEVLFPRLTNKPRCFVPVSNQRIIPSFVSITSKVAFMADEVASKRRLRTSDSYKAHVSKKEDDLVL